MFVTARVLAMIVSIPAVLSQFTIRYMPFGDSITDNGCWRPWLGEKLKEDGYPVDFVGSRRSEESCDGIAIDYDRDHEGHPGSLALDIARDESLVHWLGDNPADIVSMHLGTGDIVNSDTRDPIPTPDILEAYSILVMQMRERNPRTKILIAQIIPYPKNDDLVRELNDQIPNWVRHLNTTASPIWVVDQWTGFDGEADLSDGIHPNESGNRKIAEMFHPVLLHAVGSVIRDHYLLN